MSGQFGSPVDDASLEEVFKALQEHGVTLGRDKCRFAVSEMEFMGLLLTRKGLQTPEKKLSAIQALKAPENKSEVRSFMGQFNTWRDSFRIWQIGQSRSSV